MSEFTRDQYVTVKMSDNHLSTTIKEWLDVDFAHERSGKWPSTDACWAPHRSVLVDENGHVWIDPYAECRPTSQISTHPVLITLSSADGDGFYLQVDITHCHDRWTKRPLEGREKIEIDILLG